MVFLRELIKERVIDMWKEKLCSKKLWMTIIGDAAALFAMIAAEEPKYKHLAMIALVLQNIVYILGQSHVDASKNAHEAPQTHPPPETAQEPALAAQGPQGAQGADFGVITPPGGTWYTNEQIDALIAQITGGKLNGVI